MRHDFCGLLNQDCLKKGYSNVFVCYKHKAFPVKSVSFKIKKKMRLASTFLKAEAPDFLLKPCSGSVVSRKMMYLLLPLISDLLVGFIIINFLVLFCSILPPSNYY